MQLGSNAKDCVVMIPTSQQAECNAQSTMDFFDDGFCGNTIVHPPETVVSPTIHAPLNHKAIQRGLQHSKV